MEVAQPHPQLVSVEAPGGQVAGSQVAGSQVASMQLAGQVMSMEPSSLLQSGAVLPVQLVNDGQAQQVFKL